MDALIAEQCTALHGVPTHFLGVLGEVEKRRKEGVWDGGKLKLRTGIAAGSSVPIELMKRLIKELGLAELTNAYGMSALFFPPTYSNSSLICIYFSLPHAAETR